MVQHVEPPEFFCGGNLAAIVALFLKSGNDLADATSSGW
jgi:hypothetical protein